MATARAKVEKRVEIEERLDIAQGVIAAALKIPVLEKVQGRITDPEMRRLLDMERLAEWLESVQQAVTKKAVKQQADTKTDSSPGAKG